MEKTTVLVGLAIGICAFGVTWASARHFTGLAQEHGTALVIAVVVGLAAGLGYLLLESRLFDIIRRRGHR